MEVVGPTQSPAERLGLPVSERDVILITYGDQVRRPGEVPLSTLHDLLNRTARALINTIHILPFYPYSSDDGFSIIDYYAVDPALGGWEHIHALHRDFRLMFDAVFNHISVQSAWFQAFLRGEAPYTDYFLTVDPATDLSQVVRPRALPLMTRLDTTQGEK
jgi:sucrose phosphorylase